MLPVWINIFYTVVCLIKKKKKVRSSGQCSTLAIGTQWIALQLSKTLVQCRQIASVIWIFRQNQGQSMLLCIGAEIRNIIRLYISFFLYRKSIYIVAGDISRPNEKKTINLTRFRFSTCPPSIKRDINLVFRDNQTASSFGYNTPLTISSDWQINQTNVPN